MHGEKITDIEGELTRSFHKAGPPKTTNFQWEKKLFETNYIKDMFRLGQILCNNFCRILNSYVGSTCISLHETVHATTNSGLHDTRLVSCAICGSSIFMFQQCQFNEGIKTSRMHHCVVRTHNKGLWCMHYHRGIILTSHKLLCFIVFKLVCQVNSVIVRGKILVVKQEFYSACISSLSNIIL